MGGHLQPEQRKRLGAYYTHQEIVRYLAGWGARRARSSVMDPSCGDGRFLEEAARHGAARLVGCDLDPHALEITRSRLSLAGVRVELHGGDFFDLEPSGTEPVDLVLGNPPFVRYQRFTGETRRKALASALRLGVKLTRLTSSWAPFLLHAVQFLSPGGDLAMVVPAEITNTQYGLVTLRALQERFRAITLLAFERNLFEDAQEETYLLLAAEKGGRCRDIRLIPVGSLEELNEAGPSLSLLPGIQVPVLEGRSTRLAEAFLTPEERTAYGEVRELKHVLRIGDLGDLSNGYVTGANRFFHRSLREAEAAGYPPAWLRPTARSAKSLLGLYFTERDISFLEDRGTAHHLVLPVGGMFEPDPRALDRFVREGEGLGVAGRYKCRTRNPWWRVPGVAEADVLLGYMIGTAPKAAVNRAGAAYTNSLHGLRLRGGVSAEAVVLGLHTSVSLLSVEVEGRTYGGGVLKMEPTEMARVLVPCPPLGERALRRGAERVDRLLREGRFQEALEEADRVVLSEGLGLPEQTIARLRSGRHRLVRRRTGRAAGANGP